MAKSESFIQAAYREPYRFFFPLGILIGLGGVGHWLAYAAGWMESYSGALHASIQMQGYMTCFVFGFLLTAIPKFAKAAPCSKKEFWVFALLMLGIWMAQTFHRPVLIDACFMGMIVTFFVFAGSRFGQKKEAAPLAENELPPAGPPVEFVWIPIAMLFGFMGSASLILGRFDLIPHSWMHMAEHLLEQGYLFSIVVGVGGFLAPRLMGRTEVIPKAEVNRPEVSRKRRKRKALIYLAGGVLLFVSFLFEAVENDRIAYGIRAVIATSIFYHNHAWPFWPRIKDGYVKLLWLSIGFVIVGHWGAAFFPEMYKAMLHFVFLGGYSLMTFGVGTMVIFSHGGKAELLRKPLWTLRIVGFAMVSAVLFRVISVALPEQYFLMLGISSSIWMFAALFWCVRVLPVIASVPSKEEFERYHEKAKKRVTDSGS